MSRAIVLLLALVPAFAQDPRAIVEESQRRGRANSQTYEGVLEVIAADSKVTKKSWQFLRTGSYGNSKAIIRFNAPAEVKGVALLIVNHPDRSSDQWMWTPAIGRDRRIALQDRSTRFFGTDFSFEGPGRARRQSIRVPPHRRRTHRWRALLAHRVPPAPKQNQPVQPLARLDSQGQLRPGAIRKLHQGSARPPPPPARHSERARHLDSAHPGNDRPAPQQPHHPPHGQARIQPADEG